MTHLHFRRTVYKSGGSAASARVAYITRQPVHELDRAAQQLRYIGGEREDLVCTNSRNRPAWTQDKPQVYFQAAERYEGSNRVAFEEWKISLPQEMDHRANLALARDLVQAIAQDRLPVVYGFHDPTTMDSQQHQHLRLGRPACAPDGCDGCAHCEGRRAYHRATGPQCRATPDQRPPGGSATAVGARA